MVRCERLCRASERSDTERRRESGSRQGTLFVVRRKDGVCSGSAGAERERGCRDGSRGHGREEEAEERSRRKGQRRDIEVSWAGVNG